MVLRNIEAYVWFAKAMSQKDKTSRSLSMGCFQAILDKIVQY